MKQTIAVLVGAIITHSLIGCSEPPSVLVYSMDGGSDAPVNDNSDAPVDGSSETFCQDHGQCESKVCDQLSGACVEAGKVVYIDSQSVSTQPDCGTSARPCRTISEGMARLSSERSYMYLAPGSRYSEPMPMRQGLAVVVLGNGATIDLMGMNEFGMHVPEGAHVRVEDLTITNVSVAPGVQCQDGALTLERVSIVNNDRSGVVAYDCHMEIAQSKIADNQEVGIVNGGGSLSLQRSIIAKNREGGTHTGNVDPLSITNSLFLHNGNLNGLTGAIGLDEREGQQAVVAFNTIVGNSADNNGVGIVRCSGKGSIQLTSNILYENNIENGYLDQIVTGCDDADHNLAEFAIPGMENIVGQPEFIDEFAGDYHLSATSDALDRGDATLQLLIDFDGNARPSGAGVDIGAFELQQ